MDISNLNKSIGLRIRERRKEIFGGQAEAGAAAGIKKSAWSALERGRSSPSIGRLAEIAELLQCSVAYLIGETSSPEPPAPAAHAAESPAPYAPTPPPASVEIRLQVHQPIPPGSTIIAHVVSVLPPKPQ